MRTDDFVQDDTEPRTIEREIRVMRLRLRFYRWDLDAAFFRRPRDRHFRGLPECPDVIAAADKVEIAEARIRELEQRKRLQNRVAA